MPWAAAPRDRQELRRLLDRPGPLHGDDRELRARPLRRFYAGRDFAPLWGPDEAGATRAARLGEVLAGAADHGLEPADYHEAALRSRAAPTSGPDLAERELLLTDALFRYAADVRTGRARPEDVEADWAIPAPPPFDPGAALTRALGEDAFEAWLAALPPPPPEYARLTGALRRYREIAARGGWRPVPPGRPLRPGASGPRVAALGERLAAEGDLAGPGTGSASYDAEVEAAVRRFQARHGLAVDGVVGPATLRALNVPVAGRLQQVALNLERWRWIPRDLGPRHLAVNAAAAMLALVEDGGVVLVSRVVVGEPQHPTPLVQARVSAVLVNPAWNIPSSIAAEEMLPALRRNRRHLADRGIVILERRARDPHGLGIDWAAVSPEAFPFRLVQRPGPRNPLGSLKFDMPNRFDVYLHDTPLRSLFERPTRALSHGCVRVERARELAAHVLAGQPLGEPGALAQAIAAGATRMVPVARPLPVYFLYWTAFAEADGTVHFRDDVYGRDRRLAAALAGDPIPPAAGRALGCPSP